MTLKEQLAQLVSGDIEDTDLVPKLRETLSAQPEVLQNIVNDETMQTIKKSVATEWENTKGAGLKAKNQELLAELKDAKTAKEKAKKLDELLDTAGVQDYDELIEHLDSQGQSGGENGDGKGQGQTQDTVKLKREARKLATTLKERESTLENLQATVQDQENFIKKVLTEDEMRNQLLSAGFEVGVANVILPGIQSGVTFEITKDPDTGKRRAITPDGLTPADHVKAWLESDAAKPFRINRANGGGAGGGKPGGQGPGKPFTEMTYEERVKLYRENKPLYDKLKAETKR